MSSTDSTKVGGPDHRGSSDSPAANPRDLEDGRYLPTDKEVNPDIHHSQDNSDNLDEYTA